MIAYTQARDISLTALSFGAVKYANADGTFTIETDAVDQATLQSAVDAAPVDNSAANATTLRQKATTALTNNQTYLGVASPTNAQVRDQVAALTRQMDGVIRLLLNQLDTTTGT